MYTITYTIVAIHPKLFTNPSSHIDARLQAAYRTFYGLGCEGGVSPVVPAHMYKVAVQQIFTYVGSQHSMFLLV